MTLLNAVRIILLLRLRRELDIKDHGSRDHATMSQIPLNAAASIGDNNRQVTSSLPPEVIQCLENARFVSAQCPVPTTLRVSAPLTNTTAKSSTSPHAPITFLTSPS
jgi:hypothetical protein